MTKFPAVGSVWGSPSDPDTWRLVKRVTLQNVDYEVFHADADTLYTSIDYWDLFVAGGAVDITALVDSGRRPAVSLPG